MLRRRLLLFTCVALVCLTGVLLVYWQRTGKLTIFGDAPVTPATLEITTGTDLAKGVAAGDGGTMLDEGIVTLTKQSLIPLFGPGYAKRGTAEFVLGNAEVTQIYRVRLLGNNTQPEGTAVALDVAGSLDGISFGEFVSAGNVSLTQPITIDLAPLIAPGSHFVVLRWTLTTTNTDRSPQLAGFALDYETAGDPTAMLINRTSPGVTDRNAESIAARPRTLAATGGSVAVLALLTIAIATGITFLLRRRQSKR